MEVAGVTFGGSAADEPTGGTTLTTEQVSAALSVLGRTTTGLSLAFLKVDLCNLWLSDVEVLRGYPALQDVALHNNRLTSLAPLEALPDLLRLVASKNRLSSVEATARLSAAVNYLDLSTNSLPAVPRVCHMTQLTELYLDENQLSSLEGVQGLPMLRVLSARRNALTSLSVLRGCACPLAVLRLDHNHVSDLAPLAGLAASLQELTLSYNEVTQVEALA
eukprot:RCo054171